MDFRNNKMGNLLSRKVNIPGVVYSEDWKPPETEYHGWRGSMQHVVEESVPDIIRGSLEHSAKTSKPSPDEVPYTFWEKIGVFPIHVDRLRPRQYYIPTTDFRYYDYDEMSPEERELKERWMARLFDYNWQVPTFFFSTVAAASAALPTKARMPLIMFAAIGGSMAEGYRVVWNASVEREVLDDFIVAKEIWYIKNVETPQYEYCTFEPGKEPEVPRRRVSYARGEEH